MVRARRLLAEHPLALAALTLSGPSPNCDERMANAFRDMFQCRYFRELCRFEDPNYTPPKEPPRPSAPAALLPVIGALGGLQVCTHLDWGLAHAQLCCAACLLCATANRFCATPPLSPARR